MSKLKSLPNVTLHVNAQLLQAMLGIIEVLRHSALAQYAALERYALQPPVQGEIPLMVGAGK